MPGVDIAAHSCRVRDEHGVGGEPLPALANGGELAVALLLDGTPSALEGEQFVVPDRAPNARAECPRFRS